ncbi:MAG: hypothetical protein HKN87_12220 [Saprospiraceae bacterium]|nr:hypothetical protein [Saprospiraceae bacterium]
MKDGKVGWNPGKLNPDILEQLGPTDPKLPALSIFQQGSEIPSAILSNYALHLAIIEQE